MVAFYQMYFGRLRSFGGYGTARCEAAEVTGETGLHENEGILS